MSAQRRINSRTEEVLNALIKLEQDASQVYLGIGVWCELNGYFGAAKYFRKQSAEEQEHLHKLIQYMADRNVAATIPASDPPSIKYDSLKSALEASLDHEILVTDSYNEAKQIAVAQKDNVTATFFNWYLLEQVEEEARVTYFLDRIETFGESPDILFMVDKELEAKAG